MGRPDDFHIDFSALFDRAIAQHWVIAQHRPYDRKHFEQVFGQAYERRWAELLGRKTVVREESDESAFRRAVRGLFQPTELERLEAANALNTSQQAELDAVRAREGAAVQAAEAASKELRREGPRQSVASRGYIRASRAVPSQMRQLAAVL